MKLHAIILAAGDSRRYGTPKQLAPWHGGTLLQHAITQAMAVCHPAVTVVLGARAETIHASLPDRGIEVVHNPDWREGMASSIRAGIAALPDRAEAALIMLCDQPMISETSLSALAQRWRQNPQSIVASRYNGTHGVPAVFPRAFFAELLALRGDRGARQVMNAHPQRLETLPLPEAGVDIDTPADLQNLLSERSFRSSL